MSPLAPLLQRLGREDRGAVMIEFAILGPLLIIAVLGVYQIGVGMQAYNALRSITAETGRQAAVDYQRTNGNGLDEAQIQDVAEGLAMAPPYNLNPDRLDVSVEEAETQRVAGARELTLSIQYSVPTLLSIMGMSDPQLTQTRPIFVTEAEAPPPAEDDPIF